MRDKWVTSGILAALALLTITLLCSSPTGHPAQAAPQSNPPVPEMECPDCPDSVGSGDNAGVKVRQYIQWSGCQTWDCYTNWWAQGPACLYEMATHECTLDSNVSEDDPAFGCRVVPGSWPSDHISDPRARCDTDGDGELEDAAGTWYHNFHAVAHPLTRRIGEDTIYSCQWVPDYTYTSWSFAEFDQCRIEICDPPATPGITPTCYIETTPLVRPTDPPPQPTPFVPVAPDAEAAAYIHSNQDVNNGAYRTGPEFKWPWQHFLDASLTANVSEPTVPGCSTSSTVEDFYFVGSVGQAVCTDDEPGCRWRPAFRGGAPDVTSSAWVHLLWAYSGITPTQPATWAFAPVGPVWVDIQYSVTIHTTYLCGTQVYDAYWPKDLTLRVGLLRTTRTR